MVSCWRRCQTYFCYSLMKLLFKNFTPPPLCPSPYIRPLYSWKHRQSASDSYILIPSNNLCNVEKFYPTKCMNNNTTGNCSYSYIPQRQYACVKLVHFALVVKLLIMMDCYGYTVAVGLHCSLFCYIKRTLIWFTILIEWF